MASETVYDALQGAPLSRLQQASLPTRFQPGVSGNPSGRPSAAKRMRELLDAVVEETGAAFRKGILEGRDALIVESIRQQVGAPRQAVAVAAIDATPFAEDLARALAAYAVDLLPPPA